MVDGLSYSDYNKENFDCGRYQQLCEINGKDQYITKKIFRPLLHIQIRAPTDETVLFT